MLKNVMVAQIKKFKKQSPFIFEFPHHFPPAPHHSSPAFALFHFSILALFHFCTSALGVYFLKVNKLKVNFSKVYFSKVYLSKVY